MMAKKVKNKSSRPSNPRCKAAKVAGEPGLLYSIRNRPPPIHIYQSPAAKLTGYFSNKKGSGPVPLSEPTQTPSQELLPLSVPRTAICVGQTTRYDFPTALTSHCRVPAPCGAAHYRSLAAAISSRASLRDNPW